MVTSGDVTSGVQKKNVQKKQYERVPNRLLKSFKHIKSLNSLASLF